MAKAMKCDRCGNFYDVYNGYKYRENGNTYNNLYLHNDAHGNALNFDMCPICMDALISFMKGGKNDVKETL